MTLVLTIESAPHPQPTGEKRLDDAGGVLMIGRASGADWRIEDPGNIVSRHHCTINAHGGGRFTVTDTSTGGLFLDDAASPLGSGTTTDLHDGMRLRLGDVVIRVAMAAAAPAAAPGATPATPARDPFDVDGFFSEGADHAPRPPRPENLPPRFEEGGAATWTEPAPERRGPPGFDDPLTLDPVLVPLRPATPDPVGADLAAPTSRMRERPPPVGDADDGAGGFAWAKGWSVPPPPPATETAAGPPPAAGTAAAGDADAALAAFLRGLGLDPVADRPGGPAEARLEAFGREYRLMATGLMQLLRMRAEEKGSARIARTVIGASGNNPLKLMPTVEDALAVMLAPRGQGFADTEGAIAGAVQDLARHQIGTWRGIQTALRRMIDRFDPKAVEAEVETLGLLGTLLAGGRKARLWDLYVKRFAGIARSAESRFLGEIGADFRDAYESEERKP